MSLYAPADPERATVDVLASAMAGHASVAVGLPAGWVKGGPDHLQVMLSGTPLVDYPALFRSTIRLTAWASTRTTAKAVASRALAVLAAHPGSPDASRFVPLTGIDVVPDDETGAVLATCTVRLDQRGQSLPA